MTRDRNSNARGIVELALAFHRAPAQHADLLHGRVPLPRGVDTLLKLAGGSDPGPDCAALAPPDELKAAALFFIEQVMFRHGVSHYRVLGVEPGASLDQIKERHRLLMRVFHPDREGQADDRKSTFATRINLAYAALRDPDVRRAHDATSRTAPKPGKVVQPARRPPPIRPAAAPAHGGGLPPIVMRFLPQWVLAGTALVAFTAVGAVYMNNLPAPAIQAVETARISVTLREIPEVPALAVETAIATAEELPPEPDALLQPPADSMLAEHAPVSDPAALPRPAPAPSIAPPVLKPLPAPMPVPAVARVPAPPAATVKVATRPLLNETPVGTISAGSPVLPVAAPRPAEKQTTRTVSSVAPIPAQAPPRELPVIEGTLSEPRVAVAAAQPTAPDPDATLAQFLSCYERGDMQAFMALFDEPTINRAGGKPQIRQQHESLFRSTDLRHLDIEGMAWSQEGDWIRGEGRYRKTVMPKGTLRLQTETGVFRIELLRRGKQALIMGLDYRPGGRS